MPKGTSMLRVVGVTDSVDIMRCLQRPHVCAVPVKAAPRDRLSTARTSSKLKMLRIIKDNLLLLTIGSKETVTFQQLLKELNTGLLTISLLGRDTVRGSRNRKRFQPVTLTTLSWQGVQSFQEALRQRIVERMSSCPYSPVHHCVDWPRTGI